MIGLILTDTGQQARQSGSGEIDGYTLVHLRHFVTGESLGWTYEGCVIDYWNGDRDTVPVEEWRK